MAETLDKILQIRLPASLHNSLTLAAQSEQRSVATMARLLIERQLGASTPAPTAPGSTPWSVAHKRATAPKRKGGK